jgi:hypothetical protein
MSCGVAAVSMLVAGIAPGSAPGGLEGAGTYGFRMQSISVKTDLKPPDQAQLHKTETNQIDSKLEKAKGLDDHFINKSSHDGKQWPLGSEQEIYNELPVEIKKSKLLEFNFLRSSTTENQNSYHSILIYDLSILKRVASLDLENSSISQS